MKSMDHPLPPGIRLLAESENLLVVHEYEYASIYFKRSKEKILVDDFYGDPCCALISPDEDWVLIGGEHLTLWKDGLTRRIDGIHWIDSLRLVDTGAAYILVDPWSDDSAIWKIDISTMRLDKVRDFTTYREEPYTEDIEW